MDLSYNHDNKVISQFVTTVVRTNEYKSTKFMKRFKPTNFSTIFNSLLMTFTSKSPLRAQALNFTHEQIVLADGGTVCFHHYFPTVSDVDTPLIFILGTFEGVVSIYETLLVTLVEVSGWNVVTFHRRGVHCELTSPYE